MHRRLRSPGQPRARRRHRLRRHVRRHHAPAPPRERQRWRRARAPRPRGKAHTPRWRDALCEQLGGDAAVAPDLKHHVAGARERGRRRAVVRSLAHKQHLPRSATHRRVLVRFRHPRRPHLQLVPCRQRRQLRRRAPPSWRAAVVPAAGPGARRGIRHGGAAVEAEGGDEGAEGGAALLHDEHPRGVPEHHPVLVGEPREHVPNARGARRPALAVLPAPARVAAERLPEARAVLAEEMQLGEELGGLPPEEAREDQAHPAVLSREDAARVLAAAAPEPQRDERRWVLAVFACHDGRVAVRGALQQEAPVGARPADVVDEGLQRDSAQADPSRRPPSDAVPVEREVAHAQLRNVLEAHQPFRLNVPRQLEAPHAAAGAPGINPRRRRSRPEVHDDPFLGQMVAMGQAFHRRGIGVAISSRKGCLARCTLPRNLSGSLGSQNELDQRVARTF